MKFAIEKRDLFMVPKDYFLCHCISADFALGAGIAKKFAEMGVREALKRDLGQPHPYQWNGFGDCFLTQESEWRGEYNLVTKDKCWQKPTKETLRQALEQMYAYSGANDKIAMPKIGCGLDRLKWDDVEQTYERVLDFIKNDPNFEGNPLSVDEVWEICQYVYYTWDRSLLSTINELEQDRLKLKEERNKYLNQNDELMREIANFYHKVADVMGSDAE